MEICKQSKRNWKKIFQNSMSETSVDGLYVSRGCTVVPINTQMIIILTSKPLHFAARFGHTHIVQRLMHFGADASLVDLQDRTAGDLAEFFGHSEVGNLLKSGSKQTSSSVLVNLGSRVGDSSPSVDARVFLNMSSGSGGASIIADLKQHVQFFSGNPLKRQSEKRPDAEWIKDRMTSHGAKFTLYRDLNPLHSKGNLVTVSWNTVKDIIDPMGTSKQQWLYLGAWKDEAWFGLDVTSATNGTDGQVLSNLVKDVEKLGSFDSFRPAAFKFDVEHASIAATARSILDWNLRHPYCPACGSKTVSADAGFRRQCTSSKDSCPSHKGVQNYAHPRTDPVIITAVVSQDGQRIMLGRNTKFPKGFFSCVAGFMEPGESIDECVRRECKEELGIEIGRIMVHSSQPWPFPAQLMIGCVAVATTEKFEPEEDELEEARWFGKTEVMRALDKSSKVDLRSDASGRLTGGLSGEDFFLPPSYAIAHSLIKAWAAGEVDIGSRGSNL